MKNSTPAKFTQLQEEYWELVDEKVERYNRYRVALTSWKGTLIKLSKCEKKILQIREDHRKL